MLPGRGNVLLLSFLSAGVDPYMNTQDHEIALNTLRTEIELEMTCTVEAIEELRSSLLELERLLANRQYEEASAFGYQEISAGFVYLQRCLGGIEQLHGDEQLLLKELPENTESPVER